MRNLKKFLALVMALVMTFSLMLTANAASKYDQVKEWTDKDQVTEEFVEAVDVLSGMEIFQGDERGFAPGSTITRAETAALIYRLATGDVEDTRAGLYANYGNFTDVNEGDWFAGYVGYCANAGYIKGTSPTTFNPYAPVTGYEALAMILRVVGYDKNHEFEGAAWQTNVSALGTRLGVLDDVKTSDYANTLHLASRRDVVASILFNTAKDVDTVTYTPALGYETQKVTIGTSDGWNGNTLGWINFGLTKVEGIIVGNQDTGESKTIINSIKKVNGTPVTKDGYYEYFYDNDQYLTKTATTKTTVTTSAKIDAKTGINMFGHKVKAWYCNSTSANGAALSTTFALYDNVKKTALVTPLDTNGAMVADATNSLLSKAADGDAPLGRAAQKAGFSVDLKDSKAVFNYSFSKSANDNSVTGSPAATGDIDSDYNVSAVSTYVANTSDGVVNAAPSDTALGNTGVANSYPLYLLISNNNDLTVDMVVALNVSVSRITQVNAYASIPTVTVAQKTPATDNAGAGSPLPAAWNDKKGGMIDQKALTATSDKALDTPVVGVAIVGTNPYKPTTASTNAIGNTNGGTSALSYRLSKPAETVEGTVTNFNYTAGSHDGSIVIGGKRIERSLLADAISQYDPAVSPAVPTNRGMTAPVNLSATAQLYGNYRAYLDEEGKYIWVEPIYDTKFVYATYLDYTTPYGSSSYEYTLIGVDLNGEQVKQVVKTVDGVPISAANYQEIAPYRDSTNVAGVTPLFYQGFLLDGAGNLTSISDSDGTANKPGLFDTIAPAVYQAGAGASSNATANRGILDVTNPVVIDTTDAKLGTVNLAKGTNTGKQAANTYFTDDTKFIVVDGAGTDTQKVEVYNGLTEFLKGGSKVTITGANGWSADKAYLASKGNDGLDFNEQMYYTASPLSYASVDGTNPVKVDTIVLPKEAITWAGASGLYFIGNNAQDSEIKSGLWDPDGDGNKTDRVFHLYTMYLDGEAQQVWLTNDPNGGTQGIDKALDPDSFYKLEDTGMKTPMGDTVYHAHDGTYNPVASAPYYDDNTGIVSESTDGTRPTLPYTTAPILGDKTNKFYYEATTYASQTATIGVTQAGTTKNTAANSAIYNVADAKVVNLNAPSGKPAAGCVWPGITDLGTLNDAASTATVYQTNRPRVAVQLDPTDNLKVAVIYVCWDQN